MSETKFECQYCNKNFKNKYTLQNHIKTSKNCISKRKDESDKNKFEEEVEYIEIIDEWSEDEIKKKEVKKEEKKEKNNIELNKPKDLRICDKCYMEKNYNTEDCLECVKLDREFIQKIYSKKYSDIMYKFLNYEEDKEIEMMNLLDNIIIYINRVKKEKREELIKNLNIFDY